MPKASLVIWVSGKGINYEGNDEIVWFLNERTREKFISDILKNLQEYKSIRKKKGKMNVILIGIREEDKEILERFKNDFNFIIEESYQRKIINFLK